MSELDDMDDMDDMSCDEFAEVAAELALGVLTGRERAAALAHLDGCESCREQVRELTMVQDELLALLPSQEPSAGFESRVLERIGLTAPGQPSDVSSSRSDVPVLTDERAKRRADRLDRPDNRPATRPDNRPAGQPANRPPGRPRTRLGHRLLAAAAVAVALIGGGVGWGLRDATAPPAASQSAAVSTAAFVTSDHQTVGQVFVYKDSPWWTYMSVNAESLGDMTVRCQLEDADGHFKNVGEFTLTGGYGSWGSSPYTAGPGAIKGARLLSPNGTVLATATF
jgi:anti-sigma-K factor RskA